MILFEEHEKQKHDSILGRIPREVYFPDTPSYNKPQQHYSSNKIIMKNKSQNTCVLISVSIRAHKQEQ